MEGTQGFHMEQGFTVSWACSQFIAASPARVAEQEGSNMTDWKMNDSHARGNDDIID